MKTIKSMMDLTNRSAVITGANGHLGHIFANTLAELGARLILIDLPGGNLGELATQLIDRWNVKVEIHFCDLESEAHRARLLECINEVKYPINVLVNNAAFVGTTNLEGWSESFERQTVSTWRRAVEVNLTAAFDLSQGLMAKLKEADGASIINIASIYGEFGPDWGMYEGTEMKNAAAYAASKGGLIQLTRWLATTVAPEVRVNAISPGGIFRGQPEVFVNRYNARTPMARMATEDDFRGAIAYLASDLSQYVTGQNMMVDGGWGVW